MSFFLRLDQIYHSRNQLISLIVFQVTVSAVGINDLTGDIATAAGTCLFYWDINGHLLAKLDTADGQALHSDQILCVGFSQVNEWDPLNVIVTGGNDGCVRLWSEEMVRIAQEEDSAQLLSAAEGDGDEDQVISMRRLSIHGNNWLILSLLD